MGVLFAATRNPSAEPAAKTSSAEASAGKRGSGAAQPGGARRGAQGPVPVRIVPAARQAVAVRVQSVGSAEASATVAVKARVDGQIVDVGFREGAPVRAGDVLFVIDPRPFSAALHQAQANHQRDLAQLAQARRQEARYLDLLERGFVSKEAHAQFRTGVETAAAAARASEAQVETARLQLEYTTIRAPIDGYAGRIQVQKGNLVKANDAAPLVVVNQVHPILVVFSVPEQVLASVRTHLAAGPLEVEAVPQNAKAPARGALVFIDNAVDPATGTIKLKGQFDNRDDALWPGQFVSARLKLYEQKDALTVPAHAVQTGPKGQYVFVVKTDQSVELRPVRLGSTDGDHVVIVQGLVADEKVVTHGQLRLTPGAKVVVRDDGPRS
ncbi:MAG: hypothetical protein AMJ64_02245 [Betaproteobacteria bacterium SG8_39]|nr:MAG: hypothetical protein AMJ64_02245 [Betaproteobacteria bacterium SG8_39]